MKIRCLLQTSTPCSSYRQVVKAAAFSAFSPTTVAWAAFLEWGHAQTWLCFLGVFFFFQFSKGFLGFWVILDDSDFAFWGDFSQLSYVLRRKYSQRIRESSRNFPPKFFFLKFNYSGGLAVRIFR